MADIYRDVIMFKPKSIVLVPAIVDSLYKMIVFSLESGSNISEKLLNSGEKSIISGGVALARKYEDFLKKPV